MLGRYLYFFLTLLFSTLIKLEAKPLYPFIFRHISEKEVPNCAHINSMYTDSYGYSWITTASGLIKWYGTGYTQYIYNSGTVSCIPSNNLINVTEDLQNNLWIGSNDGLIKMNRKTAQFEIFHTHTNSKIGDFSEPLLVDHKNRIWCFCPNYKKATICIFDQHNRTFKQAGPEGLFMIHGHFYPDSRGSIPQFYIGSTGDAGIKICNIKNDSLYVAYSIFDGKHKTPKAYIEDRILIENRESVWLCADIGLVHFNPINREYRIFNLIEGEPLGQVNSAILLNDQYLIVGTQAQGLCLFDKHTMSFTSHYKYNASNPDGLAANNIFKLSSSKDGHIMIAMQDVGVDIIAPYAQPFYKIFPHKSIRSRYSNNAVKKIIAIDAQTIWGATADNELLSFNISGISYDNLLLNKINATIKGQSITALTKDELGHIWIAYGKELLCVDPLKNTVQSFSAFFKNISSGIHAIAAIKPQTLLIGDKSSLYFLNYSYQNAKCSRFTPFDSLGSIETIDIFYSYQNQKSIVLAEYGGLPVVIDHKDSLPRLLASQWSKSDITQCLAYPGNDTVLLCTKTGLYLYCLSKAVYTKVTTHKCLESPVISGCQVGNTYWVATTSGLLQLEIPTFKVIRFLPNTLSGLHTFSQNCSVVMPNGQVVFGTNNGLLVIPPTARSSKKSQVYPFLISGILVNEVPTNFDANFTNTIYLPKDSNTIAISFGMVSFNENLPTLEYRMSGIDKDWVTDYSGQTRYVNLPHGKYLFQVRQKGFPENVKRLSIIITPGWYESIWFILGSSVLLIAVVLIILNLRYKTIAQRNSFEAKSFELLQIKSELGKKIAESEMAALRSQMNPHFIFNVLNSINRFIITNNQEDASKYLTDFSKLVRLVLENSTSTKVPLYKDLDALRLYLQMEKLRFSTQFNFEINVHPYVDVEFIQIPPLLIQPYVENAIWHGLMHRASLDNKVIIDLRLVDEDTLKITVLDNGIGRAAAAEYRSKTATHSKSFGMKITQDRIAVVNQMNNSDTKVEIEDLFAVDGTPAGTKVIIVVPV